MNSIYAGKRVLSIGARRRVLEALTEALNRQGFSAVWTNRHKDVSFLIREFDALNFDIIVFGRGVSPESKERLKQAYREQNPNVTIVDGLAPITNLLVDQIKLACLPDDVLPVRPETDRERHLVIETRESCHLTIKHYTLNWLFQSKETVLVNETVDAGRHKFPFKRSGGRNFVTVLQDGIVTGVTSL